MRSIWKQVVILVAVAVLLWGIVGGVGCWRYNMGWRYTGEELLSVRSVWFWSGLVAFGCVVGNLFAMMVTVLLSRETSEDRREAETRREVVVADPRAAVNQEVSVNREVSVNQESPRTYGKPLVGLLGAMIPQMGVPLVLALIVRILTTEVERTFFLYAMLVTWLPLFALETVLALRWLNASRGGSR